MLGGGVDAATLVAALGDGPRRDFTYKKGTLGPVHMYEQALVYLPPRAQALLRGRAWVAQLWAKSVGAVRLRALTFFWCSRGVFVSV